MVVTAAERRMQWATVATGAPQDSVPVTVLFIFPIIDTDACWTQELPG